MKWTLDATRNSLAVFRLVRRDKKHTQVNRFRDSCVRHPRNLNTCSALRRVHTHVMASDRKSRLAEFAAWAAAHITDDEKGEAQIFLDRLFQAFGQKGLLEVGGKPEFRIRKAKEDGGGTALADYVWKPLVLVEMKKRGTDLARTYRQAFDYWTRLVLSNASRGSTISALVRFDICNFRNGRWRTNFK